MMMISDKGTLVRSRVDEVRVMGRNTQGVRLMRMLENEHVVGLEGIAPEEGDEEDLVTLNVVDDGEE